MPGDVDMSYQADAVDASSSGAGAPRKSRVRPVVITLLIVVVLALFVLALLGWQGRQTYEHAQRYGTQVDVTLPESCVEVTSVQIAGHTDCGDATWNLDGAEVTGKLWAGAGELRDADDQLSLRRATVDAFAVGSNAFTDGYETLNSYPQLGVVPAWLLIPFPVTVVTLFMVYRKRIKRWAKEDE